MWFLYVDELQSKIINLREKNKDIIFTQTKFYIGFPFAKLLRNFCGTKSKIFLSFRISFAHKNNNLRNHSQKSFRAKFSYSAFAKLKFCTILQLEFCAIPQFRKNQTVGDGMCFLEFISGKIFVLECFPIGHFYIIDLWQLRWVQISQFSR